MFAHLEHICTNMSLFCGVTNRLFACIIYINTNTKRGSTLRRDFTHARHECTSTHNACKRYSKGELTAHTRMRRTDVSE